MADVKRTSLFLDRDKVRAAKRVLGTATTTETVDAALAEIARRHEASQLVRRLVSGEFGDRDVWDSMLADIEAGRRG
jgi:hypothetical protein